MESACLLSGHSRQFRLQTHEVNVNTIVTKITLTAQGPRSVTVIDGQHPDRRPDLSLLQQVILFV